MQALTCSRNGRVCTHSRRIFLCSVLIFLGPSHVPCLRIVLEASHKIRAAEFQLCYKVRKMQGALVESSRTWLKINFLYPLSLLHSALVLRTLHTYCATKKYFENKMGFLRVSELPSLALSNEDTVHSINRYSKSFVASSAWLKTSSEQSRSKEDEIGCRNSITSPLKRFSSQNRTERSTRQEYFDYYHCKSFNK